MPYFLCTDKQTTLDMENVPLIQSMKYVQKIYFGLAGFSYYRIS